MSAKSRSVVVSMLIYLTTIVSLCYTAYVHLSFAADGIENVTWADIVETFPILFLFGAVIILGVSLVLIPWNQKLAARLAFAASIAGWGYYAPMSCVMSLAYSPLFPFLSITSFVYMLLPNLFLYLNMRYARQVMRQ